ncbi:hypothetical protein Taro_051484 [Colocasia esculenta]|uniref:Uncharacterized protein n=1 Tax=Colocasia esculenta TaxID=4460 RepID=A0A843XH03_COLES|nr:hypothetical protein [Colocasia esculenta]
MHSTLCYLFTCTCASNRLGFETECRGVSQSRSDPEARSEFPGATRHHRLARASKGPDPELGAPGQRGGRGWRDGITSGPAALGNVGPRGNPAGSRAAEAGASSSRAAKGPQSDLEDRLAAAVRRAEETQADLAKRETALRAATDRATELEGQAAKARVAEATRELATLRVQGSSVDQEELARLRTDLQAQQTLARGLQEVMATIGGSRSRSRSGASGASGAIGASVRQYLASSSSRRRNEEEERRHRGEAGAQSGRGGGEMPPPPDRQEGFGESGDRQ